MSTIPSIPCKAPRTETAQPDHVMLGTLRLTSVNSELVASLTLCVVGVDTVGDVSIDGWQPTQVAAKPVTNSAGNTRFICSPRIKRPNLQTGTPHNVTEQVGFRTPQPPRIHQKTVRRATAWLCGLMFGAGLRTSPKPPRERRLDTLESPNFGCFHCSYTPTACGGALVLGIARTTVIEQKPLIPRWPI